MKTPLIALALVLPLLFVDDEPAHATRDEPVLSRVQTTEAGERILVQEVWIDAPPEEVWPAYTTNEGYAAWAAPVVEVDLRVGGTIRTHYVPTAKLGDAGTNTLHIVNYVPNELITLRADVAPNWPEVMKQDGDKLTNVILFDRLPGDATRIRSYGIGYRDTPEYDDLLTFFRAANDRLHHALKAWVEDGTKTSQF